MKKLNSFVCLTGLFAAAGVAADKPNVVIILADDLGYGDIGCYGAEKIQTPNIDRLAREGRKFNSAYTASSICSPSRYGLLTGRYAWRSSRHPKDVVLDPAAPLVFDKGQMTLASLFKDNGYTTACIGKWHQGFGDGDNHTVKFDWNKSKLSPGPQEAGFDYFFGIAANVLNEPRAYIENYNFIDQTAVPPAHLVAGDFTAKAVEYIKKPKTKPFFIYFSSNVPHEPITPAAGAVGKSDCGLYGDFVQELDRNVGDILDALAAAGELDNTLILFTSDNGAAIHTPDSTAGMIARFTAHYSVRVAGHLQNGLFRGGKQRINDGGFRVPFIVRWPGHVPAGTQSNSMISLVDMLATFSAMLGKPLPANAGEDSFNALPALTGKPDVKIRDHMILQSGIGNLAIISGGWKLVRRETVPQQFMNYGDNQPQLYHLEKDPFEENNILNKHPEKVKELTGLLEKLQKADRSRP